MDNEQRRGEIFDDGERECAVEQAPPRCRRCRKRRSDDQRAGKRNHDHRPSGNPRVVDERQQTRQRLR